MRRGLSVALVGALLVCCDQRPAGQLPPGADGADASDIATVGFVYNGPVEDYGWTKTHEDGRVYLESFSAGVKTLYTESVVATEAATARAIDDLVAQGASIVFTTSFEYHPFARQATERHESLTALNCSGFKQASRFGSYQARIEEMEYLSGMVAGAMTRTNRIGVVGAVRIYEQMVHINAFALGVQATNPNAEVIVRWIGWWYDPPREFSAAEALIHEEGVDAVKQFTNTSEPIRAANTLGKYSIGHNNKNICNVAPATCLVSAYYNWGPYYAKVVDEIRRGTYPSSTGRIDYVSTADLDIAGLSTFAAVVPERVRTQVAAKREQIQQRTFNVFQGPIQWADGTSTAAGQVLSDAELLCMSKWVQGVRDSQGPSCTIGTTECGDHMSCVNGKCVAPDLSGCP